ncbi:MAG: protein translocase subunit SecF [Proteobacteria bacterium]|nr:protein translocase subunit SecF [Pseudomonadota bacterium]MBU4011637.1 protein translocase subunit SecF [Pseudomonadota bacterium]MBU4035734.1 protein translocase subunit SecF [Pseudomonadota bacterium]
MQFIKPNTKIDFIGKRYIAFSLSGLLILISIISLIIHGGLNYGIDFLGGSIIQLKFNSPVEISKIKSGLESADIHKATVQTFGEDKDNEYLIRTDTPVKANREFTDKLEQALKSITGQNAQIQRIEIVGPKVGKELQNKALLAIFYSLLFLAIYISGRFEFKWVASGIIALALMGVVYFFSIFKINMAIITGFALLVTFVFFWFLNLKYAMAAIVALVHDVLITVGMFSIFGKEFNLPIVAAVLAIIGYSLNDTIIIFDRIRENLAKHTKSSLVAVINKSLNETLSRTILTSGLTLFVVIALFVLGGGIIHDFAFALLVGMIVGVYSSIYVASPILIAWQGKAKKK